MRKPELLLVIAMLQLAGCRSTTGPLQSGVVCSSCFSNSVMTESTAALQTMIDGDFSIEALVQLALQRNPQIRESQHKIEAKRHRVDQVMSLPDPMVNTTTYLEPVQTAAGEQSFALGVSQKFTDSQRRATRAAIIREEIIAAEADFASVQLEIAEKTRSACYQLMFTRQAIEISREDMASLEQIAEVIRRQYEIRKSVTQQDVLNVQVEQSIIENRIVDLQQKEKSYQARLARLLHLDPDSEFQISDELIAYPSPFDLESLIAQAIQNRPDLQGQLARLGSDCKKVQLAHLERRPDFTVGLNWIATSSDGISPVANGDDSFLLGVGFNLPIYKARIRAGVCEAQANRRASESRFASLQANVAEEVFDLVAKLESTGETLTLIQQDIIPKLIRTLDLSIDKYSTGEIDYAQLIANWRSVLRYRITESNLQSQYNQQLALLARSVGQIQPVAPDSTPVPN